MKTKSYENKKDVRMDCTFQNTIKCEDVVIIVDSDEELNSSIKKEKQSSSKRKKYPRKVTLDTVNKSENLIITQKVEVRKQTIKCVINFNTNVPNFHIESSKSLPKKEEKRGQRTLKDRIVPTCWRVKCKCAYSRKLFTLRDQERRNTGKISTCKQSNRDHKRRPRKKSHDHSMHKYIKPSRARSKIEVEAAYFKKSRKSNLSPISKTPLKSDDEISYDDISMDSFTSWSSSNLDTLIKRTREREKNTITLHKYHQLKSKTPQSIIDIISSDNETIEGKISIHSEPTIILEHPSNNCSLSFINPIEDFNGNDDKEMIHKTDMYDIENISKAVDTAFEDELFKSDAFMSDVKLFDCSCDSKELRI